MPHIHLGKLIQQDVIEKTHNCITIKDSHPLPKVDDTLDKLSGVQIFSTFDLTSGYWQISLHTDIKGKAQFLTGSGLYQCHANRHHQFPSKLSEPDGTGSLWSALEYLPDITGRHHRLQSRL